MIVIQQEPRRVAVRVSMANLPWPITRNSKTWSIQGQVRGPVDLFFDLREMIDFTLDVVWKDIVFAARAHADDFIAWLS